MKLIYSHNRDLVAIGDWASTRLGMAKVEHIIKPHKPASTGRVGLRYPNGDFGEYFPNVIGAEWIEREDHI
jgi:hypothetical protein